MIKVNVLAVPDVERHMAEVIFDTVVQALSVLYPTWLDTTIGILTDCNRKITAPVSSVAAQFENVAKGRFIRLWCGVHQIDIVLQSTYTKLSDETSYKQLISLMSYLRRRKNIINDMK